MTDSRPPQVLAAVDLGSNSFHMVVARQEHGQIHVIDRLREMVRLAAGLDERGRISKKVAERALDCLARFGQRLRDMQAANVRAVGTNALRKAKNADEFLEAAEEALGHPIEVVSGREEARLVYLGAAQSLPEVEGRRLVVDIGGGSTELIVGSRFDTRELFSLYMGCVGITEKYFPGGKITAKRWQRAKLAAAVELEPVREPLRAIGWDEAIGTSGTIRSTRSMLLGQGWTEGDIDAAMLQRLQERVISQGHVDSLKIEGLSAERAPVYPGGLVVLQAVIEGLKIDRMRIARGSLREGLIYDMLGRLSDEDARDRSVRALETRYHIDAAQAERIQLTALDLLDQVRTAWDLGDEMSVKLLSWAARLHEMGLGIAHSQYHRHGAYLLEHSDVPGFSNRERLLLARLVLLHRRKIRPASFEKLPGPWSSRLIRLAILLRLAVVLHRGRGPETTHPIRLVPGKRELEIHLPSDWIDTHPLTMTDLDAETRYLSAISFELSVVAGG